MRGIIWSWVVLLCLASALASETFEIAILPSENVQLDTKSFELERSETLQEYERTGVFTKEVSHEEFELLQKDPTLHVFKPVRIKAHLAESIPLIGADSIHIVNTTTNSAICVLDTGVNYNHVMLGNGGFPNTKVIGGIDVHNNDADPIDDNGHGSHVAAIAAGSLLGAHAGVARGAKIVAVKILSSGGGGSLEALAEGVRYCLEKRTEFNIATISMSLGTSQADGFPPYTPDTCPDNSTLAFKSSYEALVDAAAAGLLLVASSGNDGNSSGLSYPACHPDVISVASTDDGGGSTTVDAISPFSNTHDSLDFFAPGRSIRSASHASSSGLVSNFGTSMAAPHVAGAATIIKEYYELFTGTTISTASLISTLTDTGVDIQGIAPRINVENALFSGVNISLDAPNNIVCVDTCTLPITITNRENFPITGMFRVELPLNFTIDGTTAMSLYEEELSLLPEEEKVVEIIIENPDAFPTITNIAFHQSGVGVSTSTAIESIALLAPENNAYAAATFVFQYRSSSEGTINCSLFIDGNITQNISGSKNQNLTASENITGTHSWSVQCNNATTAERIFTVDVAPPVFESVRLSSQIVQPGTTISLETVVTDESGIASVTLDGTPLEQANNAYNTSFIVEETTSLLLEATDLGGLVNGVEIPIVVDSTAPILDFLTGNDIQINDGSILTGESVTFRWFFHDQPCLFNETLAINETSIIENQSLTFVQGGATATFILPNSTTVITTPYQPILLDSLATIYVTTVNASNVTICYSNPGDYFINSTLSIDNSEKRTTTLLQEEVALELLPGMHDLTLESTDRAGNTFTTSYAFRANTTTNITTLLEALRLSLGADSISISSEEVDQEVTLVVTFPSRSMALTFDGLDAHWGSELLLVQNESTINLSTLSSFVEEISVLLEITAFPVQPGVRLDGVQLLSCEQGVPPCYNQTNEALRIQTNTGTIELFDDRSPPVTLSQTPDQSVSGSGELSLDIILTLDEGATCKYSSTNVSFENMTGNFTQERYQHHLERIYADSVTETFYYACQDQYLNTQATTQITYAVAIAELSTQGGSSGGGGGGGGGYVPPIEEVVVAPPPEDEPTFITVGEATEQRTKTTESDITFPQPEIREDSNLLTGAVTGGDQDSASTWILVALFTILVIGLAIFFTYRKFI